MITIRCDECKKTITDVVYVLQAQDAQTRQNVWKTEHHLHWECLPVWGREKGEG